MKTFLKTLFFLTLLAALAACAPAAPEEPQACTLMGCVNTLRIEITNAPAMPYWVTVRADGQEFYLACEEGVDTSGLQGEMDCENGIFTLFDFAPEAASIEIGWAAGGLTIDAIPEYETFRPNGPDCEPECRNGLVKVELPAQ